MKFSISSIFIALLLVVNAILSMLPGQLQWISMCLSMIIGCYILVSSVKTVHASGDIFQPILICNAFLFLFFVLRPAWLLLNIDSFHTLGYFKYYVFVDGTKSFFEYPFAKAELMGVVGMFFINLGYMTNAKLKAIKPFKLTQENIQSDENHGSINAICWVLFCGAALFWILFLYRHFVQNGSVSMIYIIWVYILTVSLPIYIAHKGKINLFALSILGISAVSLVVVGNRQLIVSLMLCAFVAQIQFNTNSIKKFGKTMLTIGVAAVGLAFVVVWFASVRYNKDLSLQSAVDSLFGEFGMYDMLVISLDAKAAGFVPYYWGYNYLNFFTFLIPAVDIIPFDFELVQDVFRGILGGGIPVSIVGSFYMNFGYIGMIVLSFVLGRCFSAFYVSNRRKETFLGDVQNIIFLTFVYDLARVGDIGRELIVFLIMYACLHIAFAFVNKKQDISLFHRVHRRER